MPNLRIMSWNIRTWGTHDLRADDLRRIVDVILSTQADIVCIQELQCGKGTAFKLGASIAQDSLDAVGALLEALNERDSSLWWSDASGVDYAKSGSMRDAYAFLWKAAPIESKFQHNDPVDLIEDLYEPQILDSNSKPEFPGRRPALFSINVHVGSTITPVNIISYHAMTPCNTFGKGGVGAGHGINALSRLPEIGGGVWRSTGWEFIYEEVTPLPQVDTIVLGDFNYSMDASGADFVYKSLLTYYQPCINGPNIKNVRYTTYSADPTVPFKQVSAYDNIFILKGHENFKPSLAFTGQSVVADFIKAEADQLGIVAEIRYFATEAAWYVVYKDTYRNQHGVIGISDHLPVCAEFSVGTGSASTASRRILPTSGADNNCLLHAVYGASTNGSYITDANAAARRTQFANQLANLVTAGDFPNPNVRSAVLSSMINEFSANVPVVNELQRCLTTPTANPFQAQGFIPGFNQYVQSIRQGRMLYVHEAEALAYLDNITIELYWRNQGQYVQNTINPGQQNSVNVFHQGIHFSRFNAS